MKIGYRSAGSVLVVMSVALWGTAGAAAATTSARPPAAKAAAAVTLSSYPGCVAAATDGSVWTAEQNGSIARVTPDGTVTEFPGYRTPQGGVGAPCMAASSNGALWYLTDSPGPEVVEIATDGTIVGHWPITGAALAARVMAGPDGSMWFTAYDNVSSAYEVGKITTAGTLTWPMLDSASNPVRGFVLATVGAHAWVCDEGSAGWLDGNFALHAVRTDVFCAFPAVAGPDGRLWIGWGNRVARLAESGASDFVALPADWNVSNMTVGPDHAAYLVMGDNRVGRLQTDGDFGAFTFDPGTYFNWVVSPPNGDVYLFDGPELHRLWISPWVHFLQHAYVDVLARPIDDPATTYYTLLWLDQTIPDPPAMVGLLVSTDEYLLARVDALYQQLLRRPAEPAGKAYWAGLLRSGWRAETLAAVITGSDEYWYGQGHGDIDTYVAAVYRDLLGRAPEPAGASYWHGLLASGTDRGVVAAGLVFSREALQKVVTDLYAKYLHRGSDPSGLNYWTDQLVAGMSDERLVTLLAGSDEYFGFGFDP